MRLMQTARDWLQRLFDLSPMMIIIAVVGSLIAAFTLSIYGFVRVLDVVWEIIREHDVSHREEEHLSIEFIGLIDVFLIAVILLIIALGLYQLFIDKETGLPDWLRVHTLDELKHKIVGVLCVVLAVNFVSNVSEWTGGKDILYLGAAVALVLTSLVLLLRTVNQSIREELQIQREDRDDFSPTSHTQE
jgi:uncharacterized membrane protein YqhA